MSMLRQYLVLKCHGVGGEASKAFNNSKTHPIFLEDVSKIYLTNLLLNIVCGTWKYVYIHVYIIYVK